LIEKLAVQIPNEHTERLEQKASEYDIYIQSGSMLEVDAK
jgi:formamidase